ncbi:hypothetical protein Ssi03_62390 [Sphaerisporangium siamense]|uniref:Putative DNA-binding transcriptional regulator YafY n=1 Tax=Sphaerisporangium siamense TaxID=795645 RepID=A0A7W7GBL3_9ACTN|nr:WYL domain-containing protein [Sphaerisporangium siamense]MBB4702549.1 putative DNA-binding transcriptional regulator YafY [Sphaerisporangium siamense]GII88249.1 hypothetical protein Ssi03_62390 [Sphaerisporangium siamense]
MYEVGTRVRYHGSIERLHGVIFVVAAHDAERYRLTGPYSLTSVRHASITPIDEPALRPVLAEAIAAEHPVMITYVAGGGEWTTRTIEPYELTETARGHVIVRAMDRRSGDPRSFRVDRIQNLDVLPGGSFLLDHFGLDPARAALARIRAEIRQIHPDGYGEARWTPGDPIL